MNLEFFRTSNSRSSFQDLITSYNQAYVNALGGYTGALPERFPALIGLRGGTSSTTPATMLSGLLGEFGVSPNSSLEQQIVTNFVKTGGIRFLSDSDSGVWQPACPGEQIAFMDPQNQRAILSDSLSVRLDGSPGAPLLESAKVASRR